MRQHAPVAALVSVLLASSAFAQTLAVEPRLPESLPPAAPNPGACAEGMHPAFDEAQGRYVCVKDDDRAPRPTAWRGDRMEELRGVLIGDDMSAKDGALSGLFDASQGGRRSGGDGGVAVPGARGTASVPSLAHRSEGRSRAGRSVPLPDRGEARFITVGAVDDVGNKLRDRNDKKLEEATKQQKETEKAWKDYKEGKSVSPKPPTADDVSTSGKG